MVGSLHISGLSKAWDGFRIQEIDLEIDEGEYFVLLGPTGAGKTLLLELILGFHKLDSGRIFLDGLDITDASPEERGFGYVPQDQSLFPHMTVRQNIGFGLKMRGVSEDEASTKIDNILKLLGIEGLESRYPSTLSGGERQKTAVGRALASKPLMLFLDEPLSNIDVEARREIRGELEKINRELSLTVLHVTHDYVEAESLADKVGIMRNGRMIQVGDVEQVFANPREGFVSKFLGREDV